MPTFTQIFLPSQLLSIRKKKVLNRVRGSPENSLSAFTLLALEGYFMITTRKSKRLIIGASLILGLGCLSSCSAEEEEEEGATTVAEDGAVAGDPNFTGEDSIPQVQAINLTGLGTGSTTLTLQDDDDSECAQAENAGIFSLALGGACHSAGLASNLLLGDDGGDPGGDGNIDCADYDTNNDDSGILMSLMCEDVMLQTPNVVSLGFGESDGTFGVSFADFSSSDTTTAKGSWTAGSENNFPANIRMWTGSSFSDLSGIIGINLSSLSAGTVYFDSTPFSDEMGFAMKVEVSFDAKTDASSCATAPSDDNCHWQEVKIYSGEDEITNGPPNGFHLKIWADNIDTPTFLAIEGKYRYSDANAGTFDNFIPEIRHVYFQVIEQNDIIWGKFAFTDTNDAAVTHSSDAVNTFLTSLATDGICSNDLATDGQNFSEASTCAALGVDTTLYTDLFTGSTDFENISSTFSLPDIFSTGAPTESGINTL